MAKLEFQAISKHSDQPLEVFLPNHHNGYTPLEPGSFLEFEHSSFEPVPWYAMLRNIRIAHGNHLSGRICLQVDEVTGMADIVET
ncbi:hypothetical protein BTA51_02200 [Hahella sp. CCB-MM4]|uniref:hypothetical protein n=1 Tax=Hahella sp. (strain CCB-MM4) TaxID=1926491 RepID=UPI000B9B891A|nr:hypothetical protein [Hahella sp. CCB-MM4]OZG75218.1 hypothetical protein BTA51_02200 [Hahella sp. CCB-MM4]